jgi:hypothetical protein
MKKWGSKRIGKKKTFSFYLLQGSYRRFEEITQANTASQLV